MKKKSTVPKRNPYVTAALLKTGAGAHRKSNKAQRQQEKQLLRKNNDNSGYMLVYMTI